MVVPVVTAPLSTYDSATAERVRRELECVLESPDFILPERARRFLSYIVEEALAGRADRIKAFSIGTDLFHCLGAFVAHLPR